jgi:hypothetical protein
MEAPKQFGTDKEQFMPAIRGNRKDSIGKGRNCTLETLNDKNVYAWVEGKDIVIGDLKERSNF